MSGKIEGFTTTEFEDATGLKIRRANGNTNFEYPPMNRFLNRMLALRIDDQNTLFSYFNDFGNT